MNFWREQANRCRELPLVEVMKRLGAEPNRYDPQKWKIDGKIVSLGRGDKALKFFDHKAQVGGGGAIDLVSYVLGCDFKAAVEFLSGLGGGSPTPAPVRTKPLNCCEKPAQGFVPPAVNLKHLPRVLDYLCRVRHLPAGVVEPLLATRVIYADGRRNVVFLCEHQGHVTGAELRGTGPGAFKAMARGSKRELGFFVVPHPQPKQLVIVESAIDGLSYRALEAQEPSLILSTAGVLTHSSTLVSLAHAQGVSEIAVAYDSDDPGESAAQKLKAWLVDQGLHAHRVAPRLKDWNEVLAYEAATCDVEQAHRTECKGASCPLEEGEAPC